MTINRTHICYVLNLRSIQVPKDGPGGPCANCGADNTKFKCSGCAKVVYCSEEHRVKDWEKHKSTCKSYEIRVDEKVGRYIRIYSYKFHIFVSSKKHHSLLVYSRTYRYVVATRDLEPGEEIWSERAFVVGPKASTYVLCLGCYSPWPLEGPESTEKPLCSKCSWPVCGPECEALSCHKDYECQVNLRIIIKHRLRGVRRLINV